MKVFVLTGPTGVGKSEVAATLAQKFDLDIISADSRAIYHHLDIGTAKPSQQLRNKVRFHLIDFVEPDRLYSAADFARDAIKVMHELRKAGRRFIIVGGANFYLRALFLPLFDAPPVNLTLRKNLQAEPTETLYQELYSLDPERARQLHHHDRQRIIRALEVYHLTGKTFSELTQEQKKASRFIPVYAILTMERQRLYRRIEERFDAMLAAGLIDEVRRLKEMGFGQESIVGKTYGYAEVLQYLEGKISFEAMVRLAKKRTKDYARRQLTWLRSLKEAHWFEFTTLKDVVLKIEPLLLDALPDIS